VLVVAFQFGEAVSVALLHPRALDIELSFEACKDEIEGNIGVFNERRDKIQTTEVVNDGSDRVP
jgi:hypothetical protein